MPDFQQLIIWGIFGLIVGVIAKCIMPGRDGGGLVPTIALGFGGALLGNFAYSQLTGSERLFVDALSFGGILLSIAGAFVLQAGYRMLFGAARR